MATEYIINNKNPTGLTNQFYNERTIYSHIINKLDMMKLVEPLDLTISQKIRKALLMYLMLWTGIKVE